MGGGSGSGRPPRFPAHSNARGLLVPAYDGRSLPNLSRTVLHAAGVDDARMDDLVPGLEPKLDPFEGRRAEGPIVVLLIDGLGWADAELQEARTRAGFPGAWSTDVPALTTVFPTTTTVALTSLTTAQAPSRHGVVGHRMYLPAFGTVAEILRMSPNAVAPGELLAGPDWTPSMVSATPTMFRRGLSGVALTREKFRSTAFTRLLYDGAEFSGFATASEMAVQLAEILRRPKPPVVFAYWEDLDTTQHLRGPSAEFDAFEANHVRAIFAAARGRLDTSLARRTMVVVTGDHGQVRVTPDAEFSLDRLPEVAPHLARPPTGDRRAAFLAARSRHLDALRAGLAAALPPTSTVLSIQETIDAGLLGPPPYHPEIADRLGDLLVLLPAPGGITYHVPGMPRRPRFLEGGHGGLDADELLVPLIARPLSEI
jgi:hypothetical protein